MLIKTKYNNYCVDSEGNVYSMRSGTAKKLKPWVDSKGRYLYVSVAFSPRVKKSVHRLVAETLIPNPHNRPEVNHINSDTKDNRTCNLEWVTRQENMDHMYAKGHTPIRNFKECVVYNGDVVLQSFTSISSAATYLKDKYNAPFHQLVKHLVWKEFSIIKCND